MLFCENKYISFYSKNNIFYPEEGTSRHIMIPSRVSDIIREFITFI